MDGDGEGSEREEKWEPGWYWVSEWVWIDCVIHTLESANYFSSWAVIYELANY